eukprot:8930433-Alexandrium_andersonii.AAC.1
MPGVDLQNGAESRLRGAQGEITESGGARRARFVLRGTRGELAKASTDFVLSDVKKPILSAGELS